MRKPREELITRGVLLEDPEQGEFTQCLPLCIVPSTLPTLTLRHLYLWLSLPVCTLIITPLGQ